MWKMNYGAVTGRNHALQGLPCQDKCAALNRNGVSAVALSDGAGSARLSQYGAEIAVRTACDLLCDSFEELFSAPSPQMVRVRLLETVLTVLERLAGEMDAQVGDLACTLLAVAFKGDRYLLVHVGDGVIVCQRNGRLKVASAPTNGEFTNTTVFVTSPAAMKISRVLRGTQPAMEGVLLMSDGCEAALYQKRTGRPAPLIRKAMLWNQLMASERAEGLLEQVLTETIAPRTRDDCSLALMTRPVGRFGDWERMTSREKAKLLGVETGNTNRRRRAIRKRALLWGVPEKSPASPDTEHSA